MTESITCRVTVESVEPNDDGGVAITFTGWWTIIHVPKTSLKPGDRVKITITKEPDIALPC